VPAYSFAMIRHALGERDEALRLLTRSVDEREVQATFIKIDTRWDPLRTDPRFVQLLQRLHLD
jgi:serine/threonine-protein kinase